MRDNKTLTAVSKELEIPKNTLYRRLKLLEENNPDESITYRIKNQTAFTEKGLELLKQDLRENPYIPYGTERTKKENEQINKLKYEFELKEEEYLKQLKNKDQIISTLKEDILELEETLNDLELNLIESNNKLEYLKKKIIYIKHLN